MDPGTALGVASLVLDITKDLYEYYRAWKSCEKDVEGLRIELLWLHKAFKVVRDILRDPGLSGSGKDLIYDAIQDCNDAANELRDLLVKVQSQASPQTALEKMKAQGRRASYPFKKSTVADLMENVESCRDSLHLAVDLLNLDATTETFRKLQAIDQKLADGLEGIESSLSTMHLDVAAIKHATTHLQVAAAETQDRKTLQATLAWLSRTDYSQELQDVKNVHTSGTGQWLLKSPEFAAWLQSDKNTLCCHGHPGTGKSVMAAVLIDHLLSEVLSSTTPVSYVFFNYKRQDEQTGTHVMAVLLRQMLHAMAHVPQIVHNMQDRHTKKNTRPSLDDLTSVLVSLAQDLDKLYVVVDALDECASKTRDQVMSAFRQIQRRGTVKLLVTSRPLPEILEEFTADLSLKVQASDADLTTHLRSRMNELSKCVQQRQDLQDKVVSTLLTAADGVFLLANLHMQSLKDKRTPNSVTSAIAKLPTGSDAYDRTYEIAMERINCQPVGDRELAGNVLMWISCAQEPLTITELQHALAVKPSPDPPDEDDMHAVEEIVWVCAGLVTEDVQSGIIRLVHFTAQEYFGRTRDRWFPSAHSELALRCLWYLSSGEFHLGPCPSRADLRRRFSTYPLSMYAATYWGTHHHYGQFVLDEIQCYEADRRACEYLARKDLVSSSSQLLFFGLSPSQGLRRPVFFPSAMGGLHVAAWFGLENLLQRLLEEAHEIEGSDGLGWTPLVWAASAGHTGALQVLLDHGADINGGGGRKRNPLLVALGAGHTEVIQLLLDNGVSVESECGESDCPLQAASQSGNLEVVQLLLGHGADVNARTGRYGSALQAASTEGHSEVVQLLLNNGADVNAHGGRHGSAVAAAALSDRTSVLQILRTHGARLDSCDSFRTRHLVVGCHRRISTSRPNHTGTPRPSDSVPIAKSFDKLR